MSESYIRAEIVRPKRPIEDHVGNFVGGIIFLAFCVLIVWWFFATWFPALGYTYWQLVLPVYAYRILNGRLPLGRPVK